QLVVVAPGIGVNRPPVLLGDAPIDHPVCARAPEPLRVRVTRTVYDLGVPRKPDFDSGLLESETQLGIFRLLKRQIKPADSKVIHPAKRQVARPDAVAAQVRVRGRDLRIAEETLRVPL